MIGDRDRLLRYYERKKEKAEVYARIDSVFRDIDNANTSIGALDDYLDKDWIKDVQEHLATAMEMVEEELAGWE